VTSPPNATDKEPFPASNPVVAYKRLLQLVMDNRPSGTRQRLATALGKNRSFVSQIANPAYPVPIPAQHIETMFEVCHFSHEEKRAFLAHYRAAHPGRLTVVRTPTRLRTLSVQIPDLGNEKKNRAIDQLVAEFAERIAQVIDEIA
jgi:hypothetical protein